MKKDRHGKNNPFYGKKHKPELIAKMTGKKRPPEVVAKMKTAWTPEKRAEQSKRIKSKWTPKRKEEFSKNHSGEKSSLYGKKKTPDHCKKISENAIERYKNPKYREISSNNTKKYYNEHPEARERQSKAAKERFGTPESKKMLSERSKTLWEDPEYYQNQVDTHVGRKIHSDANRKRMSETRQGENNGNWRGGHSFGKYCGKFNRPFKRYIRNKFNHICYLCGKVETSRKHCVHHIDYNKKYVIEWKFLLLCSKCHPKTSNNKWYWFNLLINYWLDVDRDAEFKFFNFSI
jgi:hypothetical protein